MYLFGMPTIYLWSRAPFIRLLLPFIAGIILQWQLQFPSKTILIALALTIAFLLLYMFLSLRLRYRLKIWNGLAGTFALLLLGSFQVYIKDVRHNENWFGNRYSNNTFITVTVDEPLVAKTNSYKAVASVNRVLAYDSSLYSKGKVILYFKRDSILKDLQYGNQLVIGKSLQEIKNSGNPANFDYKRYSLFQGITHQVYLQPGEFVVLPTLKTNAFHKMIFKSRQWVLNILRKFIKGEKERGLAEALLIGYKDDLDKNLVESYSNAGVVHVIAISGLHLGLIYWLLLLFTRPLKKIKQLAWLRLLLILTCLWLFSLLAGAQPSVLRSAIMFSCIATGEVLYRKTSIYNTLALSAFILLFINPFWLWDVGFQLSYAAVLSIIIFFKPIYNWFYIPNKAVDFFLKLNAVTLAAQLLTLPVSIYHFHQVPTLFLVTNMVAVPASSIILIGEILLCTIFFTEPVAYFLGNILSRLIFFMNSYIEWFDKLSFSIWNGLSITIVQSVLLIAMVFGFCFWLMEKRKSYLWVFTFSMLLFLIAHTASLVETRQQKKLIVYNVPRHKAIDVIVGNYYSFIGDSALLADDFQRNFHLQPSRIFHRTVFKPIFPIDVKEIKLDQTTICLIDTSFLLKQQERKSLIDVLILSKNPKLDVPALAASFDIGQVVIDGSVPAWKARLWKRACDSLQIPCYDVNEKGAFVVNL